LQLAANHSVSFNRWYQPTEWYQPLAGEMFVYFQCLFLCLLNKPMMIMMMSHSPAGGGDVSDLLHGGGNARAWVHGQLPFYPIVGRKLTIERMVLLSMP